MKLIEVKNITRQFGKNLTLFDGLSFQLETGKTLAVVGRNGSGKSSLLRILSTTLLPTQGDVLIKGFSVFNQDRKIHPLIGIMPPTDQSFVFRMTGMDNLLFFAGMQGLRGNEVKLRLEEFSQLLPLQEALHTPMYLCSTGMKQSISLCRALLHRPQLLLLDEPTRSMDKETAFNFRVVLKNYVSNGNSLIFATHQNDDIDQLQAERLQIPEPKR